MLTTIEAKRKSKKKKELGLPPPTNTREAAAYSHKLAAVLGTISAAEAELAQKIEELQKLYDANIVTMTKRALALAKSIHVYATEHREDLTEKGVRKTVELSNAVTMRWYITPPAIALEKDVKAEDIVDELKKLDLKRFIRTKEELDKELLLKEPDVANSLKGLSIKQQEKFALMSSVNNGRFEYNEDTKRWKLVFKTEEELAATADE